MPVLSVKQMALALDKSPATVHKFTHLLETATPYKQKYRKYYKDSFYAYCDANGLEIVNPLSAPFDRSDPADTDTVVEEIPAPAPVKETPAAVNWLAYIHRLKSAVEFTAGREVSDEELLDALNQGSVRLLELVESGLVHRC